MAIGTQSVTELCERAKQASHRLATLDTATKDAALEAIARELEARV
jgi:gamma-glutamyl phosphate reductase